MAFSTSCLPITILLSYVEGLAEMVSIERCADCSWPSFHLILINDSIIQ